MHVYGRNILLPKHTNSMICVHADTGVHDPRRVCDQVQPSPISKKWIHIHRNPQRNVWTQKIHPHCIGSPPKIPSQNTATYLPQSCIDYGATKPD